MPWTWKMLASADRDRETVEAEDADPGLLQEVRHAKKSLVPEECDVH